MKVGTVKKMIMLAEGFAYNDSLEAFYMQGSTWIHFKHIQAWEHYPILLRRAVEGWNTEFSDSKSYKAIILECDNILEMCSNFYGNFSDYPKTDYLTSQEQAIEACFIELLEKS